MASKHEARIKKLESRVNKLEHKTITYRVLASKGETVVGTKRVVKVDRKDLTIIYEIPICE